MTVPLDIFEEIVLVYPHWPELRIYCGRSGLFHEIGIMLVYGGWSIFPISKLTKRFASWTKEPAFPT